MVNNKTTKSNEPDPSGFQEWFFILLLVLTWAFAWMASVYWGLKTGLFIIGYAVILLLIYFIIKIYFTSIKNLKSLMSYNK